MIQSLEPWLRIVIDVSAMVGGAFVLFNRLDKRVSLMEQEIKIEFQRIHNNGFASKTDVARLEERISSVQRFCAVKHKDSNPGPDLW